MLLFVGNFWGGSCMLRVSIPLWEGFHVWRSEGIGGWIRGSSSNAGFGFALVLHYLCALVAGSVSGRVLLRMGMRKGFAY